MGSIIKAIRCTHRQSERYASRVINRQTDGQTDGQRERERQSQTCRLSKMMCFTSSLYTAYSIASIICSEKKSRG